MTRFPIRQLYRFSRTSFDNFLDLIFPPRCAGCGQIGSLFCAACSAKLHPAERERVLLPLLGIAATTRYEGPLRAAIHALKYQNNQRIAVPLADRLVETLRALEWNPDIVVPVPLHPDRLQERGYNQSALLGAAVAHRIGVACDAQALTRTVATRSQVGFGFRERQMNVEGAFLADHVRVFNKRIIIVDDVVTTGATLRSCAAALLEAGAACIWALTVASAESAS